MQEHCQKPAGSVHWASVS